MIITIDKRRDNIYSASLYVKSRTNNYQSYHVILWFEPIFLAKVIIDG